MLLLAGTFCGFCFSIELTENLVVDGGMEEWQATGPNGGAFGWNYLTISCKAVEFGRDEKENILTPKIFSQAYDTKVLKPELSDVHGGRKSLRLKGQFYLNGSSSDAFKTKDGDVYVVRYWAKGEGQTAMYIHVYGDAAAQMLETKGRLTKGQWSLIEERIQVAGRAPTTIYPRLYASEEILIDDVFVGRVIREGERKLEEVPADCQQRVAFAWDCGGKVTIDGKLDEPAWGRAVKFAGFRAQRDQALLAPDSPNFRVLFDADYLYFGFEIPVRDCPAVLRELQGQPLTSAEGKPLPKTDTFSGRESIELFIQPPGKSRYLQLVASLDGYRYDGAGTDGSWNGTWESAVNVADDRWFLELRIPAKDLGIEKIAPAEGWRINVCSDQRSGTATWAAVGSIFHNPDGFGKLIVKDFANWRQERPRRLAETRASILKQADVLGWPCRERFAAIDAFDAKISNQEKPADWQAITRAYALMGYVDYVYRSLEEEARYRGFFR